MIKRESLRFALASSDTTRITRICTVNRSGLTSATVSWHIEQHVSGAASLLHILLLLHFLLDQSLQLLVVLHALHFCCALERRYCWRELLAYLV